jgi:hypothetical protein
MELNPAPTQNRGIIGFGVLLQTEEIAKKSDGRKDAKESFAKMYEDRKMKNLVWGEMVQRNVTPLVLRTRLAPGLGPKKCL